MEDIRIGRASRSAMHPYSAGLTIAGVLSPSYLRTQIIFNPPNAGQVTWSLDPLGTGGNGIVVRSTDKPFVLTVGANYDLPMRQWFAIGDADFRVGSLIVTEFSEKDLKHQ